MTTLEKLQKFSNKHQELANTSTHGLGIILSIIALMLLVNWASEAQDMWKLISFSIFGTTLVLLYTASTLYHGAKTAKMKQFFEKIDHMAIYLLIAGSYTPFTLVTLRGAWGWTLFGIIWAIALLGIIYKMFFLGRWKRFSVILYVSMGWMAVVAVQPFFENLHTGGLILLGIGGLLYSLGVIFFIWERLPFNHAIWHLFVLGGSVCHFLAVGLYV